MNNQIIKNKKIISVIYRILGITLVFMAIVMLLSIGLFLLNYFNPKEEPFFPIVDIPLNINLPGELELTDGSLHSVIIDDAFISFNLNKNYGISGVFNFLHFLIIISIAFYIIYLLWKIFRSIKNSLKNDNPFHSENTKRIRFIALAVFISAILDILYPLILKYFWFKSITISNHVFGFRLSFESIVDFLWVLIILVIAEIYRIGSEIKKEQELTI
jgi:threonine/homoserine/homoserine lactone efflux protein